MQHPTSMIIGEGQEQHHWTWGVHIPALACCLGSYRYLPFSSWVVIALCGHLITIQDTFHTRLDRLQSTTAWQSTSYTMRSMQFMHSGSVSSTGERYRAGHVG